MNNHWFFIINPISGNGKGLKMWKKLEPELKQSGINYAYAVSSFPKHTIKIVQEQRGKGVINFIGIGGDGTLNEIANGFHPLGVQNNYTIGIIGVGTGNDWMKSLPFCLTTDNVVERIKNRKLVAHDIGEIIAGGESSYFVNVAGVGIDGLIAKNLQTSKVKLLTNLVYFWSLIKSLATFQTPNCKVWLNQNLWFEGGVFTLVAANGKYFGGGMMISPLAEINNQQLNFTAVKSHPILKVFPELPKLFTGKIDTIPFVELAEGKALKMEFDRSMAIQADGELVGEFRHVEITLNKEVINVLS